MIIAATFTGKNSLGYEHGKDYVLTVLPGGIKSALAIKRTDGTGHCPYRTITGFFENWTNITTNQLCEYTN